MKEGRRQGFPFKHVERYTPKRPSREAGRLSRAPLGQPEQLPHDGGLNAPQPQPPKGEIQPNASGQLGEESTAPQPRKPRRRGFSFIENIPFYSEAELEELRKKRSEQNNSD
jgi:hypothetical protein